jgi:hypothetical protein
MRHAEQLGLRYHPEFAKDSNPIVRMMVGHVPTAPMTQGNDR